ncbi:TolB family protein [Sphingobacterium deserti]|uniref:Uncharacterized protein n=1 Tax=Sphingobacterium deserti TaxID=1229276 RepID=A0A0B8T5F4_9SPHI|nr:hypothetical protein [Sphingobacterium deserti]KGE12829.1 hypothetical protein DI53_3383 [Sphingobacterium deserti]
MKKHTSSLLALLLLLTLWSCSKNSNTPDEPDNGNLCGNLLYDAGEQSYRLDLASNKRSVYFDRNTYALNGWDVSWDGGTRLETGSVTGEFDKVNFKLINTANGALIKEFNYDTPNSEDRQISGLLSPDGNLILIQPDFNHGIVIIDTDGKVQHHLPVVNNTPLTLGDEVVWLPNNGILLTFQHFILKSDPPYNTITPIKEMNYADWGNINVNRDGSKITVRVDKHIHLMHADGSKMLQVTDSDRQEREAVFSPDGNHLLVAADHYPGTFHSGTWNLNIIPADGKKYTVGNNPEESVRVIQPDGQQQPEKAANRMLWR